MGTTVSWIGTARIRMMPTCALWSNKSYYEEKRSSDRRLCTCNMHVRQHFFTCLGWLLTLSKVRPCCHLLYLFSMLCSEFTVVHLFCLFLTFILTARASIWMQFGDVEVLDIPVGKMGMLLMLLLFRNPLLYLIGFSRAVLALNSYLADLHITFDTTHHWDNILR